MERRQITFDGEGVDRFPDVFRTSGGRIILAYQSLYPARFRWADCFLRMRYSDDDGESWSSPQDVFHFRDIQGTTYKKGVVVNDFCRFSRSPEGGIVMSGGIQEKETGVYYGAWWESRDEGATWQGPVIHRDIPAHQITRPRILGDGCLGLLASGSRGTRVKSSFEGRQTFTVLMVSRDGGRRWEERSVLFSGDYFPAGICEPDWVVLPDGTIKVFTRADCGHMPGILFESSDNGRSWKRTCMPFLAHHPAADVIPGTERVLVCFRACHYVWPPAVGAWLEDGSPWGRFLHIHQGAGGGRYHADVGQWLPLGNGRFLLAYSIKTVPEGEVRVWTAVFSEDEFRSCGLDGNPL